MPRDGDNLNPDREDRLGNQTLDYSSSRAQQETDFEHRILRELERNNRRIDRIEVKQPVQSQIPHRDFSPPSTLRANINNLEDCQAQGGPVSSASKDNTTDDSEFSEIQEKFNVIKSSLDKVILPSRFELHDSRTGIKREDQPTLDVVSMCGRYVETALKLVSESDEGKPVDAAQLSIVLIAQLKYLQDEFAALLVKGKFDDKTSQLFRSLQKHNSGFDDASLQNVRVAAELSSIATRFQNPSRPNYRSNFQ